MLRSSIFLVALLPAFASNPVESSVSIESLLTDSGNSGTMAPPGAANSVATIPPMGFGDSSIGTALGNQGNAASVNPQRQPAVNEQPSNVGATGQLMESLLDSSSKQTGLSGSSSQDQENSFQGKTPVSEESRMIVAGMVEAFMHKQHLLPGEKSCLEDSVSQLTGDAAGTIKDVIDAIKGLMNGGAGQPGVTTQVRQKSQGSVVSAGIDGALKLTSLVTLATTLVKNCVQGDALQMLKETAHHLIDMKYLGHRLVVSGVDIAHCLADSIISYEGHHFHRFGKDIGTTLRKILLSNSTTGARLPEGVPEEEIIQKTTEGLMDGFFVGGSSMEITDSARPDVDIRLDLHQCIAGNQPFFKEIFLSIWNAIAQFSANKEQHGLGASPEGTPKWTGELMVALMQLPAALEKCDVDAETQGMFMESIQTLGQVQVHMSFPQGRATLEEISNRMAKAVEDWTDWHFEKFGKEMGVMLREFILMVYPMKYSIDKDGRLRRQLSTSWSNIFKTDGQGIAPGVLVFLLGGVASMALLGLAAFRGMRSSMHAPIEMEEVDAESGSDNLLDDALIE